MFSKSKVLLATAFVPSSGEAAVLKLPKVAQGRDSNRPVRRCVIIDLARARNRGQAAKTHEARSNDIETNLTLTDWGVLAYAIGSVSFYPALVWFFLS